MVIIYMANWQLRLPLSSYNCENFLTVKVVCKSRSSHKACLVEQLKKGKETARCLIAANKNEGIIPFPQRFLFFSLLLFLSPGLPLSLRLFFSHAHTAVGFSISNGSFLCQESSFCVISVCGSPANWHSTFNRHSPPNESVKINGVSHPSRFPLTVLAPANSPFTPFTRPEILCTHLIISPAWHSRATA